MVKGNIDKVRTPSRRHDKKDYEQDKLPVGEAGKENGVITMDRKQAESYGLTQEEEEEFYGELYHITTMNLDEYGEELDGNWVYPTFATFSQCKDYFGSMTHEELLDEACPDKDTAGIRFSIESTFCRNGEFDNDSDSEYWEQYKIVSWEDDKPVLNWSEEWNPEENE